MEQQQNKRMTIVLKPLWWVLIGQLFLLLMPTSLRSLTFNVDIFPDPIGFLLIFIGIYQLRVFDGIRPEFKRARLMAVIGAFVSCTTVWLFATESLAVQWMFVLGDLANLVLQLFVTYYLLCGLRRIAFGCGLKELHKHLMKRWSLILRVRVIGYLGSMFFGGSTNLLILIAIELVIGAGTVLAMMAVYRSMLEMQGATYDEARFDEVEEEPGIAPPPAEVEPPKKKLSIWDEEHDDPDEEYDDEPSDMIDDALAWDDDTWDAEPPEKE